MTLLEKTKYYYTEKNMNCAEAIILASNDIYDLGLNEDCAKLVMGFGGGLGCGKLCGSLAACISVLGVLYGKRPDIRDICAKFTSKFNEDLKVDSIDCTPIAAKYKTAEKRCEDAVLLAAGSFEEFLKTIN